jgi:catalase (peroxidase I)
VLTKRSSQVNLATYQLEQLLMWALHIQQSLTSTCVATKESRYVTRTVWVNLYSVSIDWSDLGHLTCLPGFDSKSGHVRSVAGRVALGQVSHAGSHSNNCRYSLTLEWCSPFNSY